MVSMKFNIRNIASSSRKGFIIIVIITITYIIMLYLFSKTLPLVFPNKSGEWYAFVSFIVSPFIALVIGLVFLKILVRR